MTSSWVAVAACTATFCGAPVGTVPKEGTVSQPSRDQGGESPPWIWGMHYLVLARAWGTRAIEPPPRSSQPWAAPGKAGPCCRTHPLRPQRPPGGGWGGPRPRRCTRSCGSRSAGACSGLRGGKGRRGERSPPCGQRCGGPATPGGPSRAPLAGGASQGAPGADRQRCPWAQGIRLTSFTPQHRQAEGRDTRGGWQWGGHAWGGREGQGER